MAAAGAQAATPVPVQRDAAALIEALGASGCRFERNGRWYGAAEAQAHLRRKFEWLQRRDMLPTTDAFIARAATSSSVTGRAYRVQCGAAAPMPSARWMEMRLAQLRRGTAHSR